MPRIDGSDRLQDNSSGTDNGVAAITVSGIGGPLLVGATGHAVAAVTDAAGDPVAGTVTWSSDHDNVATVASDGTVTALAAGSATISASAGGKTGALAIEVDNGVPALASITPTGAAVGESALTLMADGAGFVASSSIDWNGTALATTFVNATQLTAQVPASDLAAAATTQVTVVTPGPGGGTSASQPFGIAAAPNPAPIVTSVSPDSVTAGHIALVLTVTGTGFVATSVVAWNGSPRPTTFVTATQLTAQISATDVVAVGTASVTVVTPAPGGGTSSMQQVRVTAVPSAVASIAVGADIACAVSVTNHSYCWGGNYTTNSATPLSLTATSPLRTITLSPSGSGGFVCGIDTTSHVYCGATHFNETAPIGGSGMLFTAVIASGFSACGLGTDQVVYCWGSEDAGELGNGTSGLNDVGSTPGAVSGGQHYTRIAAGNSFNCGITTTGATQCWGFLPTRTEADVPTPVSGAPMFTSIAAGEAQACGLTAAGAAYCWGLLPTGDGSTALVSVPTAVGGGIAFTQLAVGDATMICGIATTMAAYCWGDGDVPLGDGGHSGSAVPVPVAGGHAFVEIAAGSLSACGVATDGSEYCWGLRGYGNIGDGTVGYATSPAAVSGGQSFASLVVGDHTSCGLTAAHQAYCWGSNAAGSVGDGTLTDRDVPTAVSGGVTFASLSDNAQDHVCALTAAGAAYCWGSDSTGELGNGSMTANSNTPVAVRGGLTFKQVSAGRGSCGVTSAGTGYCWGNAVTLGTGGGAASATPLVVAGGQTWSAISVGTDHACGITTAGAAYCWGDGISLGDGDELTQHLTPVAVSGGLTFVSIASSGSSTCGVTNTGAGYCWGVSDQTGQVIYATPTLVPGGLTWTSIKPGTADCGTTVSGLYCWGTNDMGQIGQGNINFEVVAPALIPGGAFQAFSPGFGLDDGLCATPASGATVCWGSNYRGVLGVGTFGEARTPEAITGSISLRATVQRR